MKSMLRTTLALAVLTVLGASAATVSAAALKGTAEIAITSPATKLDGSTVVTVIKVKNLSKSDVASLRIDEYWYDKAGETLPGSSKTLATLAPGAIATVELKTPRSPKMFKNSYQFSHAGGQVKTTTVPKL